MDPRDILEKLPFLKPSQFRKYHFLLLTTLALSPMIPASHLVAADSTWSGVGGDANRTTPGNWNAVPVATNVLTFDDSTRTNNISFSRTTRFSKTQGYKSAAIGKWHLDYSRDWNKLPNDTNDDAIAISTGRWKLITGNGSKSVAANQLYDLIADPGETKNLASEYPNLARDLTVGLETAPASGRTRP